MSLFDNIQRLGECFYGIRKHDNYFILDLTFPSNWRYEGLYKKEKIAAKVNKSSNGTFVISFYCVDAKDEVSFLETEVLKIIKINKDEEEKQRLLIEKKEELERLFMSKNLDELKSITFNHKKEIDLPKIPITSSNGEHNEETGVVTQADKKGQPADSESQK
jgi:hypothetical protein